MFWVWFEDLLEVSSNIQIENYSFWFLIKHSPFRVTEHFHSIEYARFCSIEI